jgi:Dullard-like phosphatase family protein
MLRNAATKNATAKSFLALQSSLLVRSVALVSLDKFGGARCFSSTESRRLHNSNSSGVRNSWVPPQSRPQSRRRGVSHTSRRPLVNGKPVAFHVNDLQTLPFQQQQQQEIIPVVENKKKYDSDLIVVLDMDECLIHSQFLSSPADARVYAHQLLQRRRGQAHTTMGMCDSFRVTLPDGDLVHVNVRPGLESFLQAVTSRYETHIFTAAMPVYANPVLDKLDPDGTRFTGRWYRDSCTYDPPPRGSGAYVKNLRRLPFAAHQLDRVVLVDNNPLSFLANPLNGILVDHFYNDPADKSLPAVLELLGELEAAADVRPLLGERFALQESLHKVARTEANQVCVA